MTYRELIADIHHTIKKNIDSHIEKLPAETRAYIACAHPMTQRMIIFNEANVDYKGLRKLVKRWLNREGFEKAIAEVKAACAGSDTYWSADSAFYNLKTAKAEYSQLVEQNPLFTDSRVSKELRDTFAQKIRKELEKNLMKTLDIMIKSVVSSTINEVLDKFNNNRWAV